jgi:pimeloyl-ACP methyl ester carboxylesterase
MQGLSDPSIWNDDPIKVPVQMILAGGRFSIWPADYEQQVRKVAANLDFAKIAGSGHCVMIDKPNEFNSLLDGFLKKEGVVRQ